MNSISTVLSRPALYLMTVDKQITPASMLCNFMTGVSMIASAPSKLQQMHLIASDTVYTVVAYGCSLNIEAYQTNITTMFDIKYSENFDSEKPHVSVGYLKPIVWFAEFCFLECVINSTRYTQTFFQGHSLIDSPVSSEYIPDGNIDSIKICFTLRQKTFTTDKLERSMLDSALAEWKRRYWEKMPYYSREFRSTDLEILTTSQVQHFHHALISFNKQQAINHTT